MTREADQDPPEKFFRASDLVWILCFVGLGMLLIFAILSIWEAWQTPTLSW